MTFIWFRRVPPVSVLVLPLLFGLSSQVAAQEPTKPEQTAEEKAKAEKAKIQEAEKEGVVRNVEEVTVTGSLIPRKDLESLSPVAVINVEEVTYQGTGRLEDLVQSLPQVFAAQNATVSNGSSGTATVQLRSLGAQRTLVLLNGRRMASGDAYATSADLNFIPAALVKRVDILTGGASSVYGADAVAGVVNFVLDTEFQGFRGEVQYNGFQHNNDNTLAQEINTSRGYTAPSGNVWNAGGVNFNLAVGGQFDGGKGHGSAYVDYRDIASITKAERDYTNCSVSALGATGPACGGSATWQYGRFLLADTGVSYVLDPATGNTNTFRVRRSTDVFNFAPYNFMQRNDTKWSGGGFTRYTFSDKVETYAEVMFMSDYSDAQIAPSGDFFNTGTINCDNPMMSAQQRSLLCGTQTSGTADVFIGRRNVEGGGRADQLTHTNWRVLGGFRGDLSPAWKYDVFGLNATVSGQSVYVNDLSVTRIADALDVVGTPGQPSTWQCRSGNPGCVPWNIFSIGGVTQAAADYIATTYMYNSGTSTKMVALNLTGDLGRSGVKLPSATEGIQVAIGGEVRKESLFVTPDEIRAGGLGAGSGGPTNFVDGNYVTKELFAETRVPLVQDTTGVQDLSLELGYRFASYRALDQTTKNNNSFKLMGSWSPIQGLRLRGGFNRAVRAPNVQELFAPQGLGLGGAEDICAGESPSATLAQCQRTGVSAAQYGHILENPAGQYNSLNGGNPQLDVEKANTITVGLVWTPKSITGLTVTLDYFAIKIDSTIAAFAPDDVIRSCSVSGNPLLCNLIHRDSLGTLWLQPTGYTESTNQNIGQLKSRGVDASFGYPWNLGDHGFVNFQLLGSYMMENRLTTPLTDYDCVGLYGLQCGIPSPKWRHRVRATWNTKSHASVSLGWRYIHKVLTDDASDQPDLANASLLARWTANGSYEIPSTHFLDLALGYRFKEKVRLTVGCNNLLDKEPPLGAGSSNNDFGPGETGTYDYLGRALYANLQFEF